MKAISVIVLIVLVSLSCIQTKQELPFSDNTNIFNGQGELIFKVELSSQIQDTIVFDFICNQFFETSPFIDLKYDKRTLFPSGKLHVFNGRVLLQPDDPSEMECYGVKGADKFMVADFRNRERGYLIERGANLWWLELKEIFTKEGHDYFYYQRNDCSGGMLGYIISYQKGIVAFHHYTGWEVNSGDIYYYGDPYFIEMLRPYINGVHVITNDRVVRMNANCGGNSLNRVIRFEPPKCDCGVKYRALESGRNRSLVFFCDSFNVSYKIQEFMPSRESIPLSRSAMNYWSAEKANLISFNIDSTVIYFRHADLRDRTISWRRDSCDFTLGQYRINPSIRSNYDRQFDEIIAAYQLERTDTIYESESLYDRNQKKVETKAKEELLSFLPPRAYSASNYTLRDGGKKRILGFKNDSMIVSYILIDTDVDKPMKPLVSRIKNLGKFAVIDKVLYNKDSSIVYAQDSEGRFKAVSYRLDKTDYIVVAYKFYPSVISEYDRQFNAIVDGFGLKGDKYQ